jgi:hypothetical protein
MYFNDARRFDSTCQTDMPAVVPGPEFFIFDYFERAGADD